MNELQDLRDQIDDFMAHHPQSPLTWEQREAFSGLDYYDDDTGIISMARTTGYTATAVAHLVAGGNYTKKGISPPEYVGESEENFMFVLKYLADRGVDYRVTEG